MLEPMKKALHAIDIEFSLDTVEVLRSHECYAHSEKHFFVINDKPIYRYTWLTVEPGIYPVSALLGTTYDEDTMKITALSPLAAYGLESIKKAIVTKKSEA